MGYKLRNGLYIGKWVKASHESLTMDPPHETITMDPPHETLTMDPSHDTLHTRPSHETLTMEPCYGGWLSVYIGIKKWVIN